MSDIQNSGAYPWALTGIFAAVHLIISIIPYTISLGAEGVISFGLISAPIIGFLLGPFFGVIAIIIGTVLGIFVNPAIGILGPFTPLAPASAALVAGTLKIGKPEIPVLIYLVGILLFLVGPIALEAGIFLWLHIITFTIAIFIMLPKIRTIVLKGLSLDKKLKFTYLVPSFFIMAFLSVMTDQLVGSVIGAYFFIYIQLVPAEVIGPIYVSIAFIYPIERIIATILIAPICILISRAIIAGNLTLPTTPFVEELAELDQAEVDKE
ncbi:MAG: conserved membrane protein of unknown function [Candidatus Thorarchaeota archaeon]|nr:MAG: conserved membrane protein of unknown function [Candidatus Thorarchaeota archaeon]